MCKAQKKSITTKAETQRQYTKPLKTFGSNDKTKTLVVIDDADRNSLKEGFGMVGPISRSVEKIKTADNDETYLTLKDLTCAKSTYISKLN